MALHSIKDFSIIYGATEITGLAEDGVSIAFNGEGYTFTIGAQGESSLNQDANESATVTINLQSTSQSNDYLSNLYQLGRNGGTKEYPLVLRDHNGNTLYTSDKAVIKRIPDTTRGKETGTNPWEIICGRLVGYEGGN